MVDLYKDINSVSLFFLVSTFQNMLMELGTYFLQGNVLLKEPYKNNTSVCLD